MSEGVVTSATLPPAVERVALCYATNRCYTNVRPWHQVPGLHVDAEGWQFEGQRYAFNRAINRYQFPGRELIGVFTTDCPGLNNMIHHAREATADDRGCDF